MNPHKLDVVVEFLRTEGRALATVHGDPLKCFGLDKMLPADEQAVVRRELAAMAEAEALKEWLISHVVGADKKFGDYYHICRDEIN